MWSATTATARVTGLSEQALGAEMTARKVAGHLTPKAPAGTIRHGIACHSALDTSESQPAKASHG